ncbi:hypothetical protein ES703_16755 [subsurface metagenome]
MDPSPTIQHLHGRLLSITGTDPAAGANISITVPIRRRWRILSVRFSLITDATEIDRAALLGISDGINTLFTVSPPAFQAASLTRRYNFSAFGTIMPTLALEVYSPLPSISLPAASIISSAVTDLQAADYLTAPQLLVEEWIDP